MNFFVNEEQCATFASQKNTINLKSKVGVMPASILKKYFDQDGFTK